MSSNHYSGCAAHVGHGKSSSSQETEPAPYLLRVSTRGRDLLPQRQDFDIMSFSFAYMVCGQWLEIAQSFLFCMSLVTWNIDGTCLFTEMNVLLLEIIHSLVQVTLVSSIRLSFAYWTCWWLDFCKKWCFPVLVAVYAVKIQHVSVRFSWSSFGCYNSYENKDEKSRQNLTFEVVTKWRYKVKGHLIFPHTHKEVVAEKERKECFPCRRKEWKGALLHTHTIWARQRKGATVKMLSKSSVEADVFHNRHHLV